MSEVGERMKGGAVKEDKSPETDAILINVQGDKHGQRVSWNRPREIKTMIRAHDLRKEDQDPR